MNPVKFTICLILSSLGCVYQIYYISEEFFEYPTTTKVTMNRQVTSIIPVVGICTYVGDIIQSKNTDIWYLIARMPFKNWFHKTPKENIFIWTGSYISDRWLKIFDYRQFDSVYSVKKLVRKNDICYSMEILNESSFDYQSVLTSIEKPVIVSFNVIPQLFKRETTINFYIHHPSTPIHGASISVAAITLPYNNDSNTILLYKVILSYTEYESIFLPSPYDTNCYDYKPKYQSEKHCFDQCQLEKCLEYSNVVPRSVVKYKPVESITFEQFQQTKGFDWHESHRRINEIKKNCSMLCKRVQCHNIDYVPIMIHTIQQNVLEISLQASPDPLFKTVSEPKINWIDYVTYILSCFGFWFGISFIQSVDTCSSIFSKKVVKKEVIKHNNDTRTFYNCRYHIMRNPMRLRY